MNPLRYGTSVDVLIGPFTDKTDGVTAEAGESPVVEVSKNGQALAAKNDSTTPAYDSLGYYNCELSTTDTGTVGTLRLVVEASASAGPVFHDFQVMAAVAYDALYGTTPTLLTAADIGQVYEATISTINSTVSFDMGTTIISDDDWIGLTVTIEDTTNGNISVRWIADVDQANDRLIISSAPSFTAATTDTIRIESRVHPTFALNSYDAPTRGEATSDREVIVALLPSALSTAGNMKADTKEINSTAVSGTGVNADKWRG